jgi:hypothetical protein
MMPDFIPAEIISPNGDHINAYSHPPEGYAMHDPQDPNAGMNEYFQSPNNLQVIQEYNKEELLPLNVKLKFWGLLSKSIKLGFWNENDEQNLFFYKNIIKVGHIMSLPKHSYTFEDRQQMNMLDLVVFADFKRGIGMEKYRINERTLQATSVTQSIQGGGGANSKRSGLLAGLKGFFS